MKPFKFICRLIVGLLLMGMAIASIWSNVIRTVAFPMVPLKEGANFVQDVSRIYE